MRFTTALLGTALFATVGCKSKQEPPPPAPKPVAAAPAPAPPPPPSNGCKPGAYNHASPDFCIEAPADFGAPAEEKGDPTVETFTSKTNLFFSVQWRQEPDTESDLVYFKSLANASGGTKSIANGALPGGGWMYHTQMESGVHEEKYLVHGKKADIVCYFQAQKPDEIAMLEGICKTLKVP